MIHPDQTFEVRPLEERSDAVLEFRCRTVAYWIQFAQQCAQAKQQHGKILDYIAKLAELLDESLVGWSGFDVEYTPGASVAEVLEMLPVMDLADELATAQALSEIERKKSLRRSQSEAASSAATAPPENADRSCPSSSTAPDAATGTPRGAAPAEAPVSG